MRQITAYVGFPMFMGDNWCAKCTGCGTVLTKFAFTKDEALKEARSERCKCPAGVSTDAA